MVNRRRLELAKPQECFGNAPGGGAFSELSKRKMW